MEGGFGMAKTWAYARASTKSQNLDRQIIQLKNFVDQERILIAPIGIYLTEC